MGLARRPRSLERFCRPQLASEIGSDEPNQVAGPAREQTARPSERGGFASLGGAQSSVRDPGPSPTAARRADPVWNGRMEAMGFLPPNLPLSWSQGGRGEYRLLD